MPDALWKNAELPIFPTSFRTEKFGIRSEFKNYFADAKSVSHTAAANLKTNKTI